MDSTGGQRAHTVGPGAGTGQRQPDSGGAAVTHFSRLAAIQDEKTQPGVNAVKRFGSGIGSLLPSKSSNLDSYSCPVQVKRTVMCSSSSPTPGYCNSTSIPPGSVPAGTGNAAKD